MVLAFNANTRWRFLLVDVCEVSVEQLVHFRKDDFVLRTLGSGERRDNRAHVQIKRVRENRLIVRLEPHALLFGVCFD